MILNIPVDSFQKILDILNGLRRAFDPLSNFESIVSKEEYSQLLQQPEIPKDCISVENHFPEYHRVCCRLFDCSRERLTYRCAKYLMIDIGALIVTITYNNQDDDHVFINFLPIGTEKQARSWIRFLGYLLIHIQPHTVVEAPGLELRLLPAKHWNDNYCWAAEEIHGVHPMTLVHFAAHLLPMCIQLIGPPTS